ncbi:prepilin peptidase [Rhodococcoides corynebacterioides]|uniref:Prepilin peptidase n=1 Tax=Rhodococcoides corynebacterioides TaxID=53972 RepID=A0ABS7P1G8_9NOCA|nr:prepilin peptidase [Rhodococcus corynebacterioides]MBY6366250.1 prepilin peptidase [Rhodococcus corynebacterioides]MBY6406839.1 prepilin peptidase [Rhodococcus corynebacterioides]
MTSILLTASTTAAVVVGMLAVGTVRRWTRPTAVDHAAIGVACGCAAAIAGGLDHATVGTVSAAVAVTAWAGALCVVDGHRARLPDDLTLPGAAAVLVAADDPIAATVGALAYASLHAAVAAAVRGSVGGGDVKLCLALGAVGAGAGLDAWVTAAALAPVLGLAVAGAAAATGVRGPHPYGPALCAATLVAWLGPGT